MLFRLVCRSYWCWWCWWMVDGGGGGVQVGRWTCVCFETRSLPQGHLPLSVKQTMTLNFPLPLLLVCWQHKSLPPLLVHVVLGVKRGLPKGASSTLPNELYPPPITKHVSYGSKCSQGRTHTFDSLPDPDPSAPFSIL